MALVFKDRVKVTSTTTGTGTLTLGSAVSGFQAFSVIGDGNTTYYTIADDAGNWEVGVGTYTASGTTLSRDTVLESSNSGSVVDFPSGTKTVFVTYPAEKSVYLDASGNVNLSGVLNPSGGIVNGAVFNKSGSGGEGGELKLEKATTSTLSGGVVIDAYNQSVRIFEDGGTNRGAQLDISAQAASVGSTILTTASTVAIANGGTGQTTAANAINALVPSQSGNTGKFLKTDGSVVSWDSPSGGSSAKTWTAFTASGTYTVPAGVSSIRAYAIGAGGNGAAGSVSTSGGGGGGGGGCAYGDIAVTAGQTVTVTISSGVATVVYGGTTMLTGNAGTNASGSTAGSGGSASKDASVTNGGAYSGGAGGAGNAGDFLGGGGGSSGSPLGNGYAGGNGSGGGAGGGGGGGIGGAGDIGGGGGAGGAGGTNGSGGSGGAGTYAGGIGRSLANAFTDPLLAECFGAGASFEDASWTSNILIVSGASGQYGGGGGSAINSINNSAYGGNAGAFGGGGQARTYGTAGCRGGGGGFMGGGGRAAYAGYSVGGNGGYGGGGGGATGTNAAPATGGSGGGAAILIYA